MRRCLPVLVAALVVLGLLGRDWQPSPILAQSASPAAEASGLVGTWQLVVAVNGAPPTPALVTFAADGTLLVADVPVARRGPGSVAVVSSGQGVWSAGPPPAFTFAEVVARGDGGVAGTNVIRGVVTLGADGQTIRGPFQFEARDPSGRVVSRGEGTFTGARMTVQPLGTPPAPATGATPTAAAAARATPSAVALATPSAPAADTLLPPAAAFGANWTLIGASRATAAAPFESIASAMYAGPAGARVFIRVFVAAPGATSQARAAADEAFTRLLGLVRIGPAPAGPPPPAGCLAARRGVGHDAAYPDFAAAALLCLAAPDRFVLLVVSGPVAGQQGAQAADAVLARVLQPAAAATPTS